MLPDRLVVVGVDPGFANVGLSAITLRPTKAILGTNLITTKRNKPKPGEATTNDCVRLRLVIESCVKFLDKYSPNLLVIENPPFGPNAFALRGSALTWGAVYALCVTRNIPIMSVAATTVKNNLTQSRKTTKQEMFEAIKLVFPDYKQWPKPVSSYEHVVDATAIALFAENHKNLEKILLG